MNRIVIAALTVLMIGTGIGSASAANSLKQNSAALSVNVSDDFVLSGRYFVASDIAVLAEFGLGQKGGDASGTDLGLGGGIRKYLSTNDFAPFVGGTLFYSSTNDANQKDLSVMGVFGAEYFLDKQFSIEGSVGFGYTSSETETPAAGPGGTSTTYKETTLGTQRFGLMVNYYLF